MLKVTLYTSDLFGNEYEEVYSFSYAEFNSAYEEAEDFRRGSNTHYMTSIEEEALGRLTGYGSVNLPAYIIEEK